MGLLPTVSSEETTFEASSMGLFASLPVGATVLDEVKGNHDFASLL
jgi:hypothetical protein